mgnify:FL=1|tara:strand:+ start:113 stop:589 length:477 start_codon:yes stop_codon:yes gene_type:complete
MGYDIVSLLLLLDEIAIISFGFLGGVYFAFSFFVMQSLNKIDHKEAINAMSSINLVILKSPFMILFFFSSFIALALFLRSIFAHEVLSSRGFASLVFLIGMFLCTAIKNVPLNDKLASFNNSLSTENEWNYYYKNWTMWNHVRTASCFLSMAILLFYN